MSEFEHVFIPASIIVGLALARLFDGVSQTLQQQRQELDQPHLIFTIGAIVTLVLVWWATYRYASKESWNFAEYALIIVYMSILYVFAAILYPRQRTNIPKFSEICTPFCLAIAWFFVVDILNMYVRGDLFSPWYYLPTAVHFIVLAAIGATVRRHGFDVFFAWWFTLTGIGWPFIARFNV